jgi:hypothetical protein
LLELLLGVFDDLRERFRIYALILLLLSSAVYCPQRFAQSASTAAQLTIKGDVEKALFLSLEDLRHLPRTTLKVMNPHDKQEETYKGVLLTELLKRAGVPLDAQLRGAAWRHTFRRTRPTVTA